MTQPPPPSPPLPDSLDEQVLAAYAAGKPMEAITAWFGVPAEQVQHIIARWAEMPSAPPVSRRKRKLWPFAVAAGVVLLLAAFVAVVVWDDGPEAPRPASASDLEHQDVGKLQSAKDECALSEAGVRVADGGHTMIFDGSGKEDFSGASVTVLACVLEKLGTPQAVIAHLDSTSALNGRQEDNWGSFTASWTYHPDNGVDLIIRVKQ